LGELLLGWRYCPPLGEKSFSGLFSRNPKTSANTGAFLMGLGLAILANSRPYEGFVMSLPVAAGMIIWIREEKRSRLRLLLVPGCLAFVALAMPYGRRNRLLQLGVTGNPFRFAVRSQYGNCQSSSIFSLANFNDPYQTIIIN